MLPTLPDLHASSVSGGRPAVNSKHTRVLSVRAVPCSRLLAPSSEIPISGAPACDRLHPIIFGRSQILPSRPLFTVAYLINLFTLKRKQSKMACRSGTTGVQEGSQPIPAQCPESMSRGRPGGVWSVPTSFFSSPGRRFAITADPVDFLVSQQSDPSLDGNKTC